VWSAAFFTQRAELPAGEGERPGSADLSEKGSRACWLAGKDLTLRTALSSTSRWAEEWVDSDGKALG